MPGMASSSGVPAHVTLGDATVQADADNSPFVVKLAEAYRRRTGSNALFERHLDGLACGLNFEPRNQDGLAWVDPDHPHTGHGFRDAMGVKRADA
jgi:hypothetical protein